MRSVVGVCGLNCLANLATYDSVKKMISRIDDHHVKELLVSDSFACYTSGAHPVRTIDFAGNDRYFVLFQGEWYYKKTKSGPAESILDLLDLSNPKAIWNSIEGIYFAVIYDKIAEKVYFTSDRMGFRYLYFFKKKGVLLWATEPKAFTAFPGFSVDIDKIALEDYFKYDFVWGERTILKGVTLLPSATVRFFDMENDRLQDVSYWNWNGYGDTETNSENSKSIKKAGIRGREEKDIKCPDFLDAAEELARLFVRSVRERFKNGIDNLETGMLLSGGLDSRAILSALENPGGIPTLTFGKKDAPDTIIAKRLSELTGTDHDFVEINGNNWLRPRLEGVWWTDGQLDILHMHGVEALNASARKMKIQINGGAQQFLRGKANKTEADFELMRLRRFQRLATYLDDRKVLTRLPFYDYRLIDFLAQVPENYLIKDRLYKQMLINHFPGLFSGIADANTGIPLNTSAPKLRMILYRLMRKTGMVKYQFHNYPAWIRQRFNVFQFFLKNRETKIYELGYKPHVDRLMYPDKLWNPLECEELCRLLTVETYLNFLDDPENVYEIIDKSMNS